MNILTQILEDIPLPRMVRIKQRFDPTALADPFAALEEELAKPGAVDLVKPGQRVAVAVGSRGVANIAEFTRILIKALKDAGALPFIVPCMGSHGGATDEGQRDVLHHLGVTEEAMGAPIHSSMEVIELAKLPNGLPVYVDKLASEADAIVVINRVKPHTAFRGPLESGIMKMIAIGLGKQKGAEACHQLGFKHMAIHVPAMANIIIERLPVIFGVALVENAYDETCIVEVLSAGQMEAREIQLLEEAKARMPRILFPSLDVLAIQYIGKNISGDGMDPNITGRYPTPYASGGPEVTKMAVLDLTPESKGNANGVGTADFTTRRLEQKTDYAATYANGLTSTVCNPTKMAMVLENDKYVLKAAIKTSNILDYTKCRVVIIRDTLHLGEIEISETLVEEASQHPDIEIMTEPRDIIFDLEGNIQP